MGGKLEIRPGGIDFFADAQEKLLSNVCDEDKDAVRAAIDKDNLLSWVEQDEPMTLAFHKQRDGRPTAYSLQTIKTRESDDLHIVIGIRQE